jgi:acyl-homoserine-lactone acylase
VKHRPGTAASIAAALFVAACSTPLPPGAIDPSIPAATVQRTAYGVAHIAAPDYETLAYGIGYAYAQDNVCLVAQTLVTVRGERSRHFGAAAQGLFGSRMLPNEQIDFFVAAHMDDAALQAAAATASADAQALSRGYVAGYNRYLAETGLARLPAECRGQPWVQPMTLAEHRRLQEMLNVQAGVGALADAVVGAAPPAPAKAAGAVEPVHWPRAADVEAVARELGLVDSPLGSNAWAFGSEATRTGRGLLFGNPHFPWTGHNRFWMLHLTVPGKLDVMGASTLGSPFVAIGFNKDVAWSHTVSTGKRFTLHELALVPGDAASYLVDGQPEAMRRKAVTIQVRNADGSLAARTREVFFTRWGPVVVVPRLGLNWTATRAYALQDANAGNARGTDAWLKLNAASSVEGLREGLATLGLPWINTIAADRHGRALYADASVVPDVDAEMLARCAPSREAAALRTSAAQIVVLDGSKAACDWKRDAASPAPGRIPLSRLPLVVRNDWVVNSNDSFFWTHPEVRFTGISPLVGDEVMRQMRTRASLAEVAELIGRGPVTAAAVQQQLFANRNTAGQAVMPDLLVACAAGAPVADAQAGCTALAGWDRSNNLDSRGALLFREFWRTAQNVPGLWRVPFDRAQASTTPVGLKMADPAVAGKVWEALAQAVAKLRTAGVALDAPLGTVQRPVLTDEPIPLHGGESFEGVLNFIGSSRAGAALGNGGVRIDYGSSYVQTVTFDARGPVAQGLLTYGQSTDPASPHALDQLRLYSLKRWPALPFHAEDVARERVGPVLRLLQR